MHLAEEAVFGSSEIAAADDGIFRRLERRCAELAARHPQVRELFERYVRRQAEENDRLENRVFRAVLVIRKDGDG